MDPRVKFKMQVAENIQRLEQDSELFDTSLHWMLEVARVGSYTYNFQWMGRPIIQYPQDIVAMQEIIWEVRPDLIIETGIAHGGSLVFSASMLAHLDMCDAIQAGKMIDPRISKRKVIGIDIDIRVHNREVIDAHPMRSRIEMIQGSSIAPEVVEKVKTLSRSYERILVCLDSNHTHEHVLAELEAYAPLVSKGSYCVVFDSVIEHMPDEFCQGRLWGKGNNPKTAVWQYINEHDQFVIDTAIPAKLQITVAPDGFLKRIK
ncbi:cephalosporin hydroxylase family protein [Aeromonas jandaei]|uniref:Cephalosporin hydroxylase family protein n=1 Tax=Aeromonas jandaei TaxID=650 RepID=A0A7T4AAQ3_AERJA|nr:cephalosporin hydroxylase family protein [Aeromonas jandaei]QQB20417.1 cephalosporin hydroxylase family protein [Aeromonas jandaei]UCA35117.1 cephalosporin hydroxylase family protein [Aeromonas jandaei]